MEQLQQVEALIKKLKAIRGSSDWSSDLEDRLLRLLKLYEKLKNDQKDVKTEPKETKSEPLVASRPEGPAGDLGALTSEQQAQVDGLVARGIPEEEARRSVLDQKPFYQSEKQLFDPRDIPEVNKLQEAWDNLSPEDQNSFLSKSPWIAGAASFADSLLPISLLWALPDNIEAQVRNAIKENQGVADQAAVAGTVLGLIGGPAGAAKIAREGAKLLRRWGTRRAGYASARALKELKQNVQRVLSDLKQQGFYGSAPGSPISRKAVKLLADYEREIKDVLADWFNHLYDKDWTLEQTRDFLEDRFNGLPNTHPLKQALGGKSDVFDNIWDRKPGAGEAPSNFVDDWFKRIKYRVAEIKLNVIPEVLEFSAALGGDAAANFTYSYNDWKDQGFSNEEAFLLGLRYTIDRTPKDLVVEALDSFFPGFGSKVFQIVFRGVTLTADLDPDTGQVRPDVYGYEKKSERKPNHANQGGLVLDPKTKFYLKSGGKVGDKIKLLMDEGKPQKQAVAIALDYKRRGKL